MIRMIQSKSAQQAKTYFSDALVKADYYLDDQEMKGIFQGRLAERLGLGKDASKEQFYALCENRHPGTGAPLTPRTKDERTVGYDINFHCPKSVSIVHALSKDGHILEAFQKSVTETMQAIEADSKGRVRKNGSYRDRQTGELVWADFTHQTARPVDGHDPDPHLHAHCYVFNMTWDETEKQMKAGQFRDIKRDMPYYQAFFHKQLSDKLADLGYTIRKTDKSFEIDGVPSEAITLFSKRTDEIGRIAKEYGITSAQELAELGARTRAKKQKGSSMAELRAHWRKQINDLDISGQQDWNHVIRHKERQQQPILPAAHCVDHALKHNFERLSVMPYRRLLAEAYKYSLGNNSVSSGGIAQALDKDKRLIRVQERGQDFCTTREVLQEEKQMIQLAQNGIGKVTPLYDYEPVLNLKGQQAEAVNEVLTTTNRVSIIRGAAGAGKTSLMREAVAMIEQKGKQVTVVAPTARASRGVLREEGFAQAETVAMLLANKELQNQLKDQVLWVDEAGLLGTKDMAALLHIAEQKNARIILGGDTRQHASVIRGDALRILNTVGGIRTAEVNKIYRQRNIDYRYAVAELSKGNIQEGFQKLDEMGAIQSVDPHKPNDTLVEDYVATLKKGKTALVVSPTHKQGEEVTNSIRSKLRSSGMIGKKEVAFRKYRSLSLTHAQKTDWRNYTPGQAVQFSQNHQGIKRGSVWTIHESGKEGIQIKDKEGNTASLPIGKPEHFEVYEKAEINLSKGDIVQITRNGFDTQDKRLNNGQVLQVAKVSRNGDIHLLNTTSKAIYTLDKEFGHLAHAHCVTSHASQGKTVDEVFISQPAGTFSATDAKQFYVSVSRARDQVKIYTDDKEGLLEHASQIGNRQSASELVAGKPIHKDYVHHLERAGGYVPGQRPPSKQPEADKADTVIKRFKDRDYEPGL